MQLDLRLLRTDPKIHPELLDVDLPADLIRGGLIEVNKARCGKETVFVEVSIYSLDQETNAKLIADFDEGKRQSVPSVEEIDQMRRKELADGSYVYVS